MIVGALSVGHIPAGVVRHLCTSTKPGAFDAFAVALQSSSLCCADFCSLCNLCFVLCFHQVATFA